MSKSKMCGTCNTPLLKEELPENRNPLPMPFLPMPFELECMVCYMKRADLDGKSSDPELQKEHEKFIKREQENRRKRFS
jgi:hypothetical protein